MALTAAQVWRDFVTDGIPSSGAHKTKKSDIRTWGTALEESLAITAQLLSADVARATKAELDAVVGDYANGDIGLVVLDDDLALRGVYQKEGGVWVKKADLPNEAAQEAQASLSDFRRRYLGALSSDPSTDSEGNPLIEGALYFNSTLGVFRVYHSGAWQNQTTVVEDGEITDAKLDPASNVGQLAALETFKLVYHKARGAWHVKAFGSSLTAVGSGSASVDRAALQAAFDAGVPVDVTGCDLRSDEPIAINTSGSRIGASMSMSRNSTKGARIRIMDPAMPVLFDVQKDNFEVSNFLIYGDATITTTIGIKFARTASEGADIDARIMNMAFDYMGMAVQCVGRGQKVADTTVANMAICGFDHDTPASWAMSGSTTDLLTTGMRGYEYSNIRAHAMSGPVIRNTGANAKNVRGFIVNGVLADIGSGGPSTGGIFKGVAVSSRFSGLNSILNVNAQGSLVQLDPGSQDTDIIGFEVSGFKDADTQRLSLNGIVLSASAADPIKRIKFIGGKIGPVDRQGVILTDTATGADIDVTLIGVTFDRVALGGNGSNYFPIFVANALNSARIKLVGCDFDGTGTGVVTPPAFVVGGKNSANVTLIRDAATTKTNIAAWAQSNVTQVTTPA